MPVPGRSRVSTTVSSPDRSGLSIVFGGRRAMLLVVVGDVGRPPGISYAKGQNGWSHPTTEELHMTVDPLAVARVGVALAGSPARADVGDPQVGTDHPWYSGELGCSTFERLFATQAEHYRRVTGVTPKTDEDRALAAWFWRNTHYFHAEDGRQDLFG